MNEIVIVRQDEGAPLLHLQAILSTGDSLTALPLGGLEVLRTQPGLINHLGGETESGGWGARAGEEGWTERTRMSQGGASTHNTKHSLHV